MNEKTQLVTLLQDHINRWENLFAGLSEEQLDAPLVPSDLSIKDTMAHLMAWQQRSIARMEAGRQNKQPEFPRWSPDLDPNAEDNTIPRSSPDLDPNVEDPTDEINAVIYKTYHDQSWAEVH